MTGGDRLRIGEVANRARVNIQTLRYYERRGLLEAPERTASGYREYPSETVRLIRFNQASTRPRLHAQGDRGAHSAA
jgi:DNA-binding transcriptional MerR regulator